MIELRRGLGTLGLLVGLVTNANGQPGHAKGEGAPGHAAKPGEAPGKGLEGKATKGAPAEGKGPDGKGAPSDKGPPGDKGPPAEKGAPAAEGTAGERKPGQGPHSELRVLRDELKAGKLKKADLEASLSKLRESNKERRDAHRAALKARWGEQLAKPDLQNELALHERRMAKLDRLLLLAQSERSGKASEKLTERVEKLIELETARHEKRLAQLSSAAPTPVPAQSAAVNTEVTK